ncbi:MAG: toxin-antitoxin system YwqK family antitoxin [Flavobacteriales bacterium]
MSRLIICLLLSILTFDLFAQITRSDSFNALQILKNDTTVLQVYGCDYAGNVRLLRNSEVYKGIQVNDSLCFLNETLHSKISTRSDIHEKSYEFTNELFRLKISCLDSLPILIGYEFQDLKSHERSVYSFSPCDLEPFYYLQMNDSTGTGIEYSYYLTEANVNVIASITHYSKGVKFGDYKEYYRNGNIKTQYNYGADGKLCGRAYTYWENGMINSVYSFEQGVIHGKLFLYNADGSLNSVEEYNMGQKL